MAREIWVNPYSGSDSGSGSSTQPLRTWSALLALLASAGNGVGLVVFDTQQAPLYPDSNDALTIGANAAGVKLTSASDDYARIPLYKVLAKAEFYRPDPDNYPLVWATDDVDTDAVIHHLESDEIDSLYYYIRVFGEDTDTKRANVQAQAGAFAQDGTAIYFRPPDDEDPRTGPRVFCRTRRFAGTGGSAVVVSNSYAELEALHLCGTCLADETDTTAVGAAIPGSAYCLEVTPSAAGLTHVHDCRINHGSKHVFGTIEGASNSEVLVERVAVDFGSPYSAQAGAQTPLVSYASGVRTGLKVTYREVTNTYTQAVPGSSAGTVTLANPSFITHSAGSGQQFAELRFVRCRMATQFSQSHDNVVDEGLSSKDSTWGYWLSRSAGVVFERCRTTQVPAGSIAGDILIRDCQFKVLFNLDAGTGTALAGTVVIEGCTIDTTGNPATGRHGVWSRLAALTLTLQHCVFKTAKHYLLTGTVNTDTLTLDNNRYQLNADDVLVRNHNDGSTTANRTLTEWKALGYDANSSSHADVGIGANGYPAAGSAALDVLVTAADRPDITGRAFEAGRRKDAGCIQRRRPGDIRQSSEA